MASKTTTTTSKTSGRTITSSQSTTKNVLDDALLGEILSGLTGQMTREEMEQYAENLLRPQLGAQLEAAQQQYETEKLAKEQEIENLARELSTAIAEQNAAYQKSMADVETAALSRGMGRSSYTLETLKNQGDALAAAVKALTDENARRSAQLQQQITASAQHNAQTAGRLNADYASSLAAKVQELYQEQKKAYNQDYMTAVSASMGKETTGVSQTTTSGSTKTTTASASASSSGQTAAKKKTQKTQTSAGGAGGASSSLRVKAMQ